MIIDIITIILLYYIYDYGSVFETQYSDYVYLLGDEKWVIFIYLIISLTLLYVDIKLAMVFMLMGFFITNDVPIINNLIFNEGFENKEENMISHLLNEIKMQEKIDDISTTLDSYYSTLKENLKKNNIR